MFKGPANKTLVFLLSCIALLVSHVSHGMKIKVHYWPDNANYIEITDSCKIWTVSQAGTKTVLSRVGGVFSIDKDSVAHLSFRIEDHKGKVHERTVRAIAKDQQEIVFEVGASEYVFFPLYQARPFYPVRDKLYLSLDAKKLEKKYPGMEYSKAVSKVKAELKSAGVSQIDPYSYDVFQIDPVKTYDAVIAELLQMDAGFMAPLVSFQKKNMWNISYLGDGVDILVSDSLSDAEINKLLQMTGVSQFAEVPRKANFLWDTYTKGRAYKVVFSQQAVLSLDMLKQLEQLSKSKHILSIRTTIGSPPIEDR